MLLKIGAFSKKTGVSIRTLRYYDEIDLFKPSEIDLFTSYRYYTDEQIEDLNIINKLKSLGFTLDEIKENWNHFTNEIMLKKREELMLKQQELNTCIKEIDQLRSSIVDGKFRKEMPKEKGKIKSLY